MANDAPQDLDNPLTGAILEILRRHPQGLSEYQLIQALKRRGARMHTPSGDDDLDLFRVHFLVMNALYRLQEVLGEGGVMLRISPLQIHLVTAVESAAQERLPADAGAEAKLREYYLDMEHLARTREEDVRALLRGFWERYVATDKRAQALAELGLEVDVDWAQIQARYRREAGRAHPDRGGDGARFVRIREAYEVLKCCYRA